MTCYFGLTRIGKHTDQDINLVEAALQLVCYHNNLIDTDSHSRHVEVLISETLAYLGPDLDCLDVCVEAVREIIAKRYGYKSEIDDDSVLERTHITTVIENRRGGALALCLLYAHVFERIGQNVEIIDFPARPLVRLTQHRQAVIVDPYQNGIVVQPHTLRQLLQDGEDSTPFALPSLTKREVLIQLQDALKLDLLRHNAPEAAICVLEASLLIDPLNPRLWRELGLLHSRLDHIEDSISALKHFLSLPGQNDHRYSVSQLLQQLTTAQDTPTI